MKASGSKLTYISTYPMGIPYDSKAILVMYDQELGQYVYSLSEEELTFTSKFEMLPIYVIDYFKKELVKLEE